MLYPVIIAGGSGTRFWPKSRGSLPKQLIEIIGNGTMIQQTVERLRPEFANESFLIITNADQADETRRQLPQLGARQIVGEPVGRDTSAAIGIGALMTLQRDEEGVMVVLAADQIIEDPAPFLKCIEQAGRLAKERHALVTLGIKPTFPSELYGYLKRGEAIEERSPKAYRLLEFKEKPQRAQAEKFLRTGEYYWNSGNFAWRAKDILEAMRRFLPELYAGLDRIRPHLGTPRQAEALAREYPSLPKISIDFGVMERADNVAIVEADIEWDDVGSWEALSRHQKADAEGNVIQGLHSGIDTKDCIIVGDQDHLVATLGVTNLVVVQTKDATLVCDRSRAGDLKQLIERLKAQGLNQYL